MRNNQRDNTFVCRGSTVDVRDGQFEKAMRKFKKKVAESGKLRELKEREQYEKPAVQRKKAKAAAKARWRRKLADESMPKKLY
ncbi:MAG TPA: 30S ribosomal protein S21 [Methanosarcina sp.]|nr:30S ribosomal protein S21 [Methanosarcina sp.]